MTDQSPEAPGEKLSIKDIVKKKNLQVTVLEDDSLIKNLSYSFVKSSALSPGVTDTISDYPGEEEPEEEKSYMPSDTQLNMINQHSIKRLGAEDVYVFELQSADTDTDRSYERFTDKAISTMAEMSPGKPMLLNHDWSTNSIVGKVFDAKNEDGKLIQYAYMPKSVAGGDIAENVLNGLYNKLSVGFAASPDEMICDSCDYSIFDMKCKHQPGEMVDGKASTVRYQNVKDYFEISIVSIPAQPAAHVRKSSSKLLDSEISNTLKSIIEESVKERLSNFHGLK